MRSSGMNVFGIISAILLSVFNLLCIIWTVALTSEQIGTGWGYGTGLEILAVLPMLISMAAISAVLLGALYILFSLILKKISKPQITLNTVLLSALIIQITLINLFIWY